MNKLVFLGLVLVGFSGCAKLETAYLAGEAVGKQVLPEEVKEEIRPYNEAIKDGYVILKEGNDVE